MRWPVLLFLLLAAPVVTAVECVAELGKPIHFQACDTHRFPGFTLRFTGTTQSTAVRMTCWNYELRSADDREEIALCHSGALGGGERRFELGGVEYVLDRDVPAACIAGRWVLGMTIWAVTAGLPPPAERNRARAQMRSFLCDEGG